MRLGELADRIEALALDSFMTSVKRRVAVDTLGLVEREFRGSVDPDGAPWKPLKYRNGRPLVLTGAMRDSFTAVPIENGVRIQAGVDYAIYHQRGTATIPARRILPSGSLPQSWVDVINKAYTQAAKAQVQGG